MFLTPTNLFNPDITSLILRIFLGVVFIKHGYPKLFQHFSDTANFLAGLGFKPPKFWAFVLATTEFFGPIALWLGFLTPLAALFLAINMVVAMTKVKRPFHEMELDFSLLGLSLALVFLGGGFYSLDHWLFKF